MKNRLGPYGLAFTMPCLGAVLASGYKAMLAWHAFTWGMIMANTNRLRFLMPLALLAGAMASPEPAAAARSYKTLYSFCADGTCPHRTIDVVADASDNIYGIAQFGGDAGEGAVFELVPNAKKTKWKYKPIWSFCVTTKCSDGGSPQGGLVIDTTGNLYGATTIGATQGAGALFRLSRNGKRWKLDTLYNFCSQAHCVDSPPTYRLTYSGAASGAPYDGVSPLYGAYYAGINGGTGAAFSFAPQAGQWTETTIYNFCTVGYCLDGQLPASILADASGNVYGTTAFGGEDNAGVVFELSPARRGWTETVLHNFCRSCTNDGQYPQGRIAIDGAGNIYGATTSQGATGNGVVFELGANGTESVLYNFCPNDNCSVSGSDVLSGIVLDAQAHIYGAAEMNGAENDGTLFRLDPTFKVLHAFCGCSGDGASARAVTVTNSGKVFGVTASGGDNNAGTVFAYLP